MNLENILGFLTFWKREDLSFEEAIIQLKVTFSGL